MSGEHTYEAGCGDFTCALFYIPVTLLRTFHLGVAAFANHNASSADFVAD